MLYDWIVENLDISELNINNAAVYKTAWLVVPPQSTLSSLIFLKNYFKEFDKRPKYLPDG